MILRKGQKELIERYRGGYCAIPAIPGGGKTFSLAMWAAEMITQGYHKPGKILIVTYMNSAVSNFKKRISEELQTRGIGTNKDYFVSTIHGLCLQIIKEKPDLAFSSDEFEVIDGVLKNRIIYAAVGEWKRRNEKAFRLYLDIDGFSNNRIGGVYKNWQDSLCRIMLSAISDFKIKGITPRKAKKMCRGLGAYSIAFWASQIYDIYDKKLKMGGFLDFDDMLYKAKKMLLEDEHLLDKYRRRYSFVCEDEAQDSNLIQTEVLNLIANGNLLRVGDSNQAICGSFSNSDFTLFKSFCEQPSTTVYSITQSSRNTKNIINLANYFVEYVINKHPTKECRGSLLPQYIETVDEHDTCPNPRIDEYGIGATVYESWEDEVKNVITRAFDMVKKHPQKTIAILIPSAWRMAFAVDYLEARGIPYEQLDNTSDEKNRTLRKMGRVVDFIATPEKRGKLWDMMSECFLTDVYDKPTNGDEEDGKERKDQRELLKSFLEKYPVEKLLYPMGGEIETGDIPQKLLGSKIWGDFLEHLGKVKELLEFPDIVVEKLILYISEKLKFCREERAIAQKVAGDIRFLANGASKWRLSDLALELLRPKNMFNYFAGVVWDLKGYEPKPGVITLATYHKSKGLEWDIVFLTCINNSDFPVMLSDKFIGEYWFLKESHKNPQAIFKKEMGKILKNETVGDLVKEARLEIISERARLLYVGITRAKEYLYLSSFEQNKGKRNETLPSRYILELKKYIEEVG